VTPNELLGYDPIAGEKGTFAYFTIKERLPAILEQLIGGYKTKPSVTQKLQLLKENIQQGKIGGLPISRHGNEDWNTYIQPYLGLSWLEAPFYFLEAYFYQLILDAVDYFKNGLDPFLRQKQNDIEMNLERMLGVLQSLEQNNNPDRYQVLKELLQLNLWGNKADLSQLHTDRNSDTVDQTIIDDSELILDLLKNGVSRIDIVLDNAGLELLTDLVLAVKLIKLNFADQVVLHAKAYPTFVSDATPSDIGSIIKYLSKDGEKVSKKSVGQFNQYQDSGQILAESNKFWNAPLHFFEMPSDLHTYLSDSDLIIFKGDANYRRIFGDRKIQVKEPVIKFTNYLPAKSVAIRILKSEIILDINQEKQRSIEQIDPDWLICGKFGIIQLLN